MVNIVFASNNIAHFPGAGAGSVVGTFDAVRVPYSIALTNFASVVSPRFIPVIGDDTWAHFRFSHLDIVNRGSGNFIILYDDQGRQLVKLAKRGGSDNASLVTTLYNGTTNIVFNNTVDYTINVINTIDVKFTINSLIIKATLYVNMAFAGEVVFNSNPNGLTKPVYFSLGSGPSTQAANAQHYSEILIGDADTRNARLSLLRPIAAGAYGDWEGSLATLADDDTTTGMTTIEAAARQTMLLSPYAGASIISNFVAASMTTRGQNSPTKLKHTVRLSTVDYDSAEIPVSNSLQYNLTDYKLNPATSLPWVASDLSAIEAGFLSVA